MMACMQVTGEIKLCHRSLAFQKYAFFPYATNRFNTDVWLAQLIRHNVMRCAKLRYACA